ncbi:suppressor APC domain-containing protein 2 [Centruroides vittatus]|uniref:suppressor APC domain-containing protein 2 n=1 Tax=Centruroides vittatus TaxID=120091 RepID=UPI00350F8A2A
MLHVRNMMSNVRQQRSTTLDGLPKQFVSSMRTLFDIMDDKKTGYVKFSEIERRWHENGSKGLPSGVLESLRKVTPTNGMLSFERFCAGLKICLLRHRANQFNEDKQKVSRLTKMANRPASVPLPEKGNECSKMKIPNMQKRPGSATDINEPALRTRSRHNHVNTATVRPNNVLSQQRALSMPQLQDGRVSNDNPSHGYKTESKVSLPTANVHVGYDRVGIMTALENWRLGIIKNSDQVNDGKNPEIGERNLNTRNITIRGNHNENNPVGEEGNGNKVQETGPSARRTLHRRREPRRHTLANGIDYNMLKRMKQLEQERDVLLQGLEAVERARDWYFHQISVVKDKMQYIGKSGLHSEYSSDMHQERLNFQAARVYEVNQHLAALMDSSEKGFLLHMNLAVRPPVMYNKLQQDSAQTIIQRLREQNQMLTEEVGKKSELITQLEREKCLLIRELFQARSQYHRDPEDITLM